MLCTKSYQLRMKSLALQVVPGIVGQDGYVLSNTDNTGLPVRMTSYQLTAAILEPSKSEKSENVGGLLDVKSFHHLNHPKYARFWTTLPGSARSLDNQRHGLVKLVKRSGMQGMTRRYWQILADTGRIACALVRVRGACRQVSFHMSGTEAVMCVPTSEQKESERHWLSQKANCQDV